MFPELFHIPFLNAPVASFGVMLMLGGWLGIQLAAWLARRSGLNGEHFVNIGVIALVSGVIGARASHVFENWSLYFGSNGLGLMQAINIRSGGLTYYGGVLLATPACVAYGLWKHIPIRRGMDIIAPCLMIGLGLGRVGCFLNGCCYGANCDATWGVTYPYGSPAYQQHEEEGVIPRTPDALLLPNANQPGREHYATREEVAAKPALNAIAAPLRSASVLPAQLYNTAAALLLAGVLVAFYTLSPAPGRVFALMMLLEGTARFVLETLRVEPPVTTVFGVGYSYSMVVGVLLVIAGAITWIAFGLADKRPATAAPAMA